MYVLFATSPCKYEVFDNEVIISVSLIVRLPYLYNQKIDYKFFLVYLNLYFSLRHLHFLTEYKQCKISKINQFYSTKQNSSVLMLLRGKIYRNIFPTIWYKTLVKNF